MKKEIMEIIKLVICNMRKNYDDSENFKNHLSNITAIDIEEILLSTDSSLLPNIVKKHTYNSLKGKKCFLDFALFELNMFISNIFSNTEFDLEILNDDIEIIKLMLDIYRNRYEYIMYITELFDNFYSDCTTNECSL
ncbi:MAG: hypothetical protein NC200_02700 [Candidatus Gastranaerophilales bacterium]|nr:hypothetical protein [Candidatus Gastranaerophilales bacterium]